MGNFCGFNPLELDGTRWNLGYLIRFKCFVSRDGCATGMQVSTTCAALPVMFSFNEQQHWQLRPFLDHPSPNPSSFYTLYTIYPLIFLWTSNILATFTLNFWVLVWLAPLQSAHFPRLFRKVLSKLVDWSCLHSLCIIRWLTWKRLKMLTSGHLENIANQHIIKPCIHDHFFGGSISDWFHASMRIEWCQVYPSRFEFYPKATARSSSIPVLPGLVWESYAQTL